MEKFKRKTFETIRQPLESCRRQQVPLRETEQFTDADSLFTLFIHFFSLFYFNLNVNHFLDNIYYLSYLFYFKIYFFI